MSEFFTKEIDALIPRIQESSEPCLLLLEGNLGVGKTTFVQELLQHLGPAKEFVQSPTFLKILEYDLPHFGSVVHMDCYRMESVEEVFELGIEYYMEKARLICVEWPQLLVEAELLPADFRVFCLKFSMDSNAQRRIELS